MSVAVSRADDNNLDSLEGYDTELRYIWGPWIRKHGNNNPGLGYPKIAAFHPKRGLGVERDVEMPEDVAKLDKLIRGLPNEVMRRVALEWYAYQGCVSKRALARTMTDWYERRGITKKVQDRDCNLWITGILMGIWYGLGCPPVE